MLQENSIFKMLPNTGNHFPNYFHCRIEHPDFIFLTGIHFPLHSFYTPNSIYIEPNAAYSIGEVLLNGTKKYQFAQCIGGGGVIFFVLNYFNHPLNLDTFLGKGGDKFAIPRKQSHEYINSLVIFQITRPVYQFFVQQSRMYVNWLIII